MAILFLRFSRRITFADFALDEKERVIRGGKNFLMFLIAHWFVWKIETG
ncbi:MAG TPA: hypothetical protein VIJ01_09105 [Candidatus Angelobacter sp.]|jgi:hypothetical protein